MKKNRIRKVLCAALMSVICFALLSVSVAADQTATFAFDNDTGIALWRTENEALIKETGFRGTVSKTKPQDGAGSLAVYENLTGTVDRDEMGNGTMFVTAAAVGLQNFAGCTITAQIYPTKAAMLSKPEITFFTDGMLYLPSSTAEWTADKWNTVAMTVPDNCDNTRLGFFIPLYTTYIGDVFYIDNITITQSDGTVVPNVGDYQVPDDSKSFSTLNPILSYILMGLLIVAGIAVVAFIIIFIVKHARRFR